MRALMKSVDVGRDGHGTTVTMRMPLTENVGE